MRSCPLCTQLKVYWKDGTKSLMIGKDCYDIDEQAMHGNRDFIYAKLEDAENHCAYKLCHGKLVKKMNVRTSTSKSYKTLQQNLAKKHQRTKGSKQMTALQRRTAHGKANGNQYRAPTMTRNQRGNKKKNIDSQWLESGGNHGHSSDDEEYGAKMRKRMRSGKTSDNESGSESGSDEDSDSDEESDDDDIPIGQRR